MQLYHDIVLCFGLIIVYLQISDILNIEKQSPFIENSFLVVKKSRSGGFVLPNTMSNLSYFLLQLNQLCLRHNQLITQLTNLSSAMVRFARNTKRNIHLSFPNMLKKHLNQFVSQNTTDLLLPELQLTNLACYKRIPIRYYPQRSGHLNTNTVTHLLHIYQIVSVIWIQDPISHHSVHLYLLVSLHVLDQIDTLPVKRFITIHYLHISYRILQLLSDLELVLRKPSLHETLVIVNLVCLTFLLSWVVNKSYD